MTNLSKKFLLVIMLLPALLVEKAYGQGFIGISVNYGDALTFTPRYADLLLERKSVSPTLVYTYQKIFASNFTVVAGGQAGVAGYQLVPELYHSTSQTKERYPFVDYGIFVSRVEATPGWVFSLGRQQLFVGVGGGLSYYLAFPYTTMSVFGEDQGAFVELFSAYAEAPDAGTVSGFAKVYVKIAISHRWEAALQYAQHFKPILRGQFEFAPMSTPVTGSLELTPKGLSLILLYRLKKEAKSGGK